MVTCFANSLGEGRGGRCRLQVFEFCISIGIRNCIVHGKYIDSRSSCTWLRELGKPDYYPTINLGMVNAVYAKPLDQNQTNYLIFVYLFPAHRVPACPEEPSAFFVHWYTLILYISNALGCSLALKLEFKQLSRQIEVPILNMVWKMSKLNPVPQYWK